MASVLEHSTPLNKFGLSTLPIRNSPAKSGYRHSLLLHAMSRRATEADRKIMPSKHKLFLQGVAATTAVFGTKDVYACPLCATLFEKSALERGELTAEHVPPKSLGGKTIILTCKRCNDIGGHSVDAEAAKRLRQQQYWDALMRDRKGHVGRATLRLGDAQIVVDLSVDDQQVRDLKVVSASNNPEAVRRFEELFDRHIEAGTTDGLKFQLTAHERFKARWARVSDLRAAFLACTAAIGYRFGLHEVLETIREQISRPDKEILKRWWLPPQRVASPTILVSDLEGVAIVHLQHASIALPSPSRPPDRYYELLDSLAEKRPISLNGLVALGRWPTSFEAFRDHTTASAAREQL